jgi:uncharacterized protein (TIGR02246 family)
MKNTTILAGALLAIACAGCNQAPPAPDPAKVAADAQAAKEKDIADIKALEDRFMNAFNAKDVEATMSAYVPDDSLLVFDAIPPRQYKGAAAYKKDFVDFFATFPKGMEATMTDLFVEAGGGDIAYGHNIQHVAGTMKDGKKIEGNVRITDVYKKVSGRWLIAHEHISFPVDILTGKADLMSKP